MTDKIFMIPRNHEYISKLTESLEAEGVDVVVLKPFHYSTFSNVAKMIANRVRGYNAIHVHWMYIFPMSIVMKWFYYFCRVLGIRIIWEMHNILPHKCGEKDKRDSKWFYEKVDAVIFHSKSDVERSRELLETNVKKKHIVIPHGNFNESYENTISKEEARSRLGIPPGRRVILCFGFIRKNRGYEYLIESTRGMEDTLVLVAGGVQDKEVHKKLQAWEKEVPNLRLYCKYLPEEEIQVFFNACDIVVLPYTNITTSGVIPLSYAFSRPVVTSSIGGIREVVTEKTGVMVPPGDPEALREAIEKIFTMDYNAMGKDAREYSEREFSWQTNARKIKALYESV